MSRICSKIKRSLFIGMDSPNVPMCGWTECLKSLSALFLVDTPLLTGSRLPQQAHSGITLMLVTSELTVYKVGYSVHSNLQ